MIEAFHIRLIVVLAAGSLLAACGSPPAFSPAGLNEAYENALRATSERAVAFKSGTDAELATLTRLEDFFAQMTAESVREKTASVYASDGWLYDNLTVVEGAGQIESYFVKAAGEVDALQVQFLQVTNDGPDYFVRWQMRILSDQLNGGAPMISYGITQFRFNQQGQVILHRDFWDAGTGLYEYLPALGGIIQRARAALAGEN